MSQDTSPCQDPPSHVTTKHPLGKQTESVPLLPVFNVVEKKIVPFVSINDKSFPFHPSPKESYMFIISGEQLCEKLFNEKTEKIIVIIKEIFFIIFFFTKIK